VGDILLTELGTIKLSSQATYFQILDLLRKISICKCIILFFPTISDKEQYLITLTPGVNVVVMKNRVVHEGLIKVGCIPAESIRRVIDIIKNAGEKLIRIFFQCWTGQPNQF